MSSDPQTYDDLKTSIATWLVRSDQTDRIPEYIALAERRLNRVVFCPEREATTTLTAAASVTLPTDFSAVRAIWLDTDPKVVLDQMTLNELRQAYSGATTGQPGNYAISGNQLILGPSPDSAYSIELAYWQAIEPLSDSVADNWLLLAHSDLYLCAALAEAFLGTYDEQRAVLWENRTEAKIAEVNAYGRHQQYGGAPFRIRSAVVV